VLAVIADYHLPTPEKATTGIIINNHLKRTDLFLPDFSLNKLYGDIEIFNMRVF
jgi:hypothetical protein